jgi:YihY family inner membrane protein
VGVDIKGIVRRLDTFQRERPWLGFPIAVFKKFSQDKGGYLAALVAYYGFFSMFPLLLVLVTVLGLVVGNYPELQDRILNSALTQFPIIGDQIRVKSLHGSGIALAIGIAGALWAGTAVVQALENAMDRVWDVPARKKPNAFKARLKALVILGALGVATLVATGLSGIAGASGGALSLPIKTLAFAGSLAVNFGVFLVAFKVLTAADVSWRDVRAGALLAALGWGVLQSAGNYIVSSQLSKASETYGIFAIVIGLLSWLFIGAQLTILAAEVNVVRVRRLWPRSLQPPLTDADRRALELQAKEEKRRPEEAVDVVFVDESGGPGNEGVPPDNPAGYEPGAADGPQPGVAAADLPLPDLVRRVAEDTKALLQQEVQLAKHEMAGKLKTAGKGAGSLGAAGLVAVFAACALVAALILGVATVVAGSLAGIAVTLLLCAVAGLIALRGRKAVEKATPLVPERAMEVLASTRQRLSEAWQAGADQDNRHRRGG